jgi:hypothetical protein
VEELKTWMIPVRTKSGAEVTAVQTLREFRKGNRFCEVYWSAPAAEAKRGEDWSGSGDGAFEWRGAFDGPIPLPKSGVALRLPLHSKIVRRLPATHEFREASWSAPALWRFRAGGRPWKGR